MSNKVFCGGLPWATGDSDLAASLAVFGEVTEAKVVMDRETGRSRGFGFVTFASEASANQAVAAATLDIGGRSVRIDASNDRGGGGRSGGPSASGPRGGGGGGGGGGGRPPRFEERGGRPRQEDERGGGRGERRRGRDRF